MTDTTQDQTDDPFTKNIEALCADLAARIPEMAKDSPVNNAQFIKNKVAEAVGVGRCICIYCKKVTLMEEILKEPNILINHVATCEKNPAVIMEQRFKEVITWFVDRACELVGDGHLKGKHCGDNCIGCALVKFVEDKRTVEHATAILTGKQCEHQALLVEDFKDEDPARS